MPFPGDERRSMSVDIMETMRMIVTQILLPKVGGGKVGCREYMVFDEKIRAKMLDTDIDEWPQLARRLLKEGNCIGRSMSDAAQELFEKNLISKETFNYIGSRNSDKD